MLSSLLGDGSDLSPLKRVITERTEGNPFFMEETVQVLLDEGALVRDGASVRLTKPLNELKIPPTVQAILAARIDRLLAGEKTLLQTLAVIGKEFPLSIVREVAKVAEDELNQMLSVLQLAEFIYEQPAVSDTEYTFKHALTQEVAYNSVLAERRRTIHEQAARAIETLYAQNLEDRYGELARHYLLGNDSAKALHYVRLAIAQAVNRAAYSEARNLVDAGLRVLDKVPDDRARLEAELWLRNVESTIAFVFYGASSQQRERAIKRVCELSEKIGERDQLLHAMIDLSNLQFVQGEPARGLELARQGLELAKAEQDPELCASAHWVAACSADACGNLAEAVMHYDEAIRWADRVSPGASLWGMLLAVGPLNESCAVRLLLGRVDEAAALAEEGLRRARQSGHLFSLGHALTTGVGRTMPLRREPERMLVHADEQIALTTEHGLFEWLNWGRLARGQALSDLGRLKEAVPEMESGLAAFR
jgi:predicted ATPase